MNLTRVFYFACLSWLLVGCAEYEQYPHPYVSHDKLPFTEGSVGGSSARLQPDPCIGVCNVESEVVSPVGAYFVENHLQEPIALGVDISSLADVVSAELASAGATTVRINEADPSPSDPTIDPSGVSTARVVTGGNAGILLKATVKDFEYSRHGLKKSPYDFLYLTIRFALRGATDGKLLWQRDVSVYRKNSPSPDMDQKSMAGDAIRQAVHCINDDADFRSTLQSTQKAG